MLLPLLVLLASVPVTADITNASLEIQGIGLSVVTQEPPVTTGIDVSTTVQTKFGGKMNDDEANWIQFITSLIIHEAGILQHGAIMPKAATLTRPGAADLFGDGFRRGAACTNDFSQADHLTMAAWSLTEVREHYGVPAADLLG